jgi:hypothetical protein
LHRDHPVKRCNDATTATCGRSKVANPELFIPTDSAMLHEVWSPVVEDIQ